MSDWLTKLVAVLELETVDDDLLNHIDEILGWESVRNQNEKFIELSDGLGEEVVQQRFEELLDRLIVGDFALGKMFPSNISDEQAKKRYRKLIRVFHPDRGFKSQVWLNHRAERINKAYQQFLDQDVKADLSFNDFSEQGVVREEVAVKSKSKSKSKKTRSGHKFRYRADVWRDRLGSPQEFQNKVVSTLLVIALILIFLVYLSNRAADVEPVSTFISSGLENGQKTDVKEDYVVDSNAKKILQEADVFLEQSEELAFQDFSDNESFQTQKKTTIELDEFINELEEVAFLSQENVVPDDNDLIDKNHLTVVNGESIVEEGERIDLLIENSTSDQVTNSIERSNEFKSGVLEVKQEITSSPESNYKKNQLKKVGQNPEYLNLMKDMKVFYESGDSRKMSELYIASGRENEIRSAEKIRKYYRKAFSKTDNRSFDYTVDSYGVEGESTVSISGKLDISMSIKKTKEVNEINAFFSIVLIKLGSDFKIVSFEWEHN